MSNDPADTCLRSGSWFRGCRFDARYEERDGISVVLEDMSPSSAERMLKAAKNRIYVHDICIRCGKIVARELPQKARKG